MRKNIIARNKVEFGALLGVILFFLITDFRGMAVNLTDGQQLAELFIFIVFGIIGGAFFK